MRVLSRLISVAILFLVSSFVHASQRYTFEYTFYNGDKLSGLFNGDASGDLISNISDMSATYTGQVSQSEIGFDGKHHEDATPFYWSPGNAVISIQGGGNNFFFQHTDLNTGDYFIFFSLNNSITVFNNSHTISIGTPLYHNHWNVSAVPEPETYVMLLAGLSFIFYRSRQRKQPL